MSSVGQQTFMTALFKMRLMCGSAAGYIMKLGLVNSKPWGSQKQKLKPAACLLDAKTQGLDYSNTSFKLVSPVPHPSSQGITSTT